MLKSGNKMLSVLVILMMVISIMPTGLFVSALESWDIGANDNDDSQPISIGPMASPLSDAIGLQHLLKGVNILSGKELTNQYLLDAARLVSDTTSDGKSIDDVLRGSYDAINVDQTYARTFSGHSVVELIGSRVSNLTVSADAKVNVGKVFKASASAKYKEIINMNYSTSSDSLFFQAVVNHAEYRNRLDYFELETFNLSPAKEIIRDNLVDTFEEALQTTDPNNWFYNPKNLFDTFGTHFITSYNMGGWIESITAVYKTKESLGSGIKTYVEAKAGLGALGQVANASVEFEEELKDDFKDEFEEKENYYMVKGGREGLLESQDKFAVNVNEWLKQFERTGATQNCQILTDDSLRLIGIWELLPDDDVFRYNQLISYYIEESVKQDLEFFEEFKYRKEPIKTEGFRSVSHGSEYVLAVKADGSIWAWGNNEFGQLGNGTNIDSYFPIPIMLDTLDEVKSVYADALDKTSMALTYEGNLWVWGNQSYLPECVMSDVANVWTSESYVLVLKNDGSLWAWGYMSYSDLIFNRKRGSDTPLWVMNDVTNACVAGLGGRAIKTDGSLWVWGDNQYGQLGDGTTTDSNIPKWIMDNVISISASQETTMAIKNDGSLWAWGANFFGELGDGTTTDSYIPKWIMNDVVNVSFGLFYTMAIKTDSSLWAW